VTSMNFIGLDIHKKTISYCVKDGAGEVLAEGTIPASRVHLEGWMKALAAPLPVKLGRRIRALRTERGWTQAMFADHAELAREHLSERENGHKEIGVLALERMCERLG
jgi:hypothetical protein